MAERRMFSKTIIDSDAFLDMPLSTQALYFHLSMRADDEGFINNPKKIQRMIGASDDDIKVLIAKQFVISFDSGIVVIRHWKLHNYIQKDRFKPTIYKGEKSYIVEENGIYNLNKVSEMYPTCIQDVYKMDTQDRLGKDNIGQYNIGKYIEDVQQVEQSTTKPQKSKNKFVKPTVEEIRDYCIERKNNISAQYFYDYYEANGWKVGKNPMKDWKATLRNWERRDFYGGRDTNSGNNIQVNSTNSDMSEWGF